MERERERDREREWKRERGTLECLLNETNCNLLI